MHPPYDAHMSESCLSLNVFTPVAAIHNASALPIFVWIYGGSLVLGSVASYGPIENLGTSGRAMLGVLLASIRARYGDSLRILVADDGRSAHKPTLQRHGARRIALPRDSGVDSKLLAAIEDEGDLEFE